MSDSQQWFTCRDVVGRPAKGVVTIREGQLTVKVPCGETAVFTLADIAGAEQLLSWLAQGVEDLREQRRERRS